MPPKGGRRARKKGIGYARHVGRFEEIQRTDLTLDITVVRIVQVAASQTAVT
jgi:hypothetical protein